MTPLNPDHVEWSRKTFATMREGGVWGLPRSGLLFTKRGNTLTMTARMPHDPAMPITEAQLRKQQDSDLKMTVLYFGAAGIVVTDDTGE